MLQSEVTVGDSGQWKVRWIMLGCVALAVILQVWTLLVLGGILSSPITAIQREVHNLKSDDAHRRESNPSSTSYVKKEEYGRLSTGQLIHRYTLHNDRGMEVSVITYGGCITSAKVADMNGSLVDVVLGYDNLEGYVRPDNPYFGCLIGRVSNRIANGSFTLDGRTHHLNTNDNGINTLHGGPNGWHRAVWKGSHSQDKLTLHHISEDGDEHFPGEVHVNVTFSVTEDNELCIVFSASTSGKPTPINLTTHPYFNLAGEGEPTVYDHVIQIFAEDYLPVNDMLIPTGRAPVMGPFDLLSGPKRLGFVIPEVYAGGSVAGFDHNFCLRGPTGRKLAARIFHPGRGIVMEVYTNQPGLQLYTGNYLNVANAKNGHAYQQHAGFCVEPQNYPDAVNQPSFPDSVLYPGSIYMHQSTYKFSTTHP